MKNLLSSILVFSGVLAIVPAAQADDCNSSVSYIQVPGRSCVDLTHLSVLGASQEEMSAASNLYNQAIDLNTSRPDVTYSRTVGDGDRAVSTSTTYRDNPSLSEQAARQRILQGAAKNLDNTAADHAVVSRWSFQRQLRALGIVSGTLTNAQR